MPFAVTPFEKSGSFSPECLERLKEERGIEYLSSLLVSCEKILENITGNQIILGEFYSRLAKNGAEIYLHKIRKTPDEKNFNVGEKVLMYDDRNTLFALGGVKEYPDGLACKAVIFV